MNNEASENSLEGERLNNVYDVSRSVRDIFAETASRVEDVDTSSDEYFNRQPSGRVASSPWDYNKLRGLKRYLKCCGWLERSGWLECFGWLGCHCSHAALEGLNWKDLLQGDIYIYFK